MQRLRELGFDGSYRGGKHPYMVKGGLVLTIPNPHNHQIGVDLLSRILKQADISKEIWLKGRQKTRLKSKKKPNLSVELFVVAHLWAF